MEYPLPSTKGGTPILGLVYPRYFMPRLGIPGVQISRGVHQPGYTGQAAPCAASISTFQQNYEQLIMAVVLAGVAGRSGGP